MIDAFIRAFGAAMEDGRKALIDQSWFGDVRLPPGVSPEDFRSGLCETGATDRALHDQQQSGSGGERGFLGWLQGEHATEAARSTGPLYTIDRGIDR